MMSMGVNEDRLESVHADSYASLIKSSGHNFPSPLNAHLNLEWALSSFSIASTRSFVAYKMQKGDRRRRSFNSPRGRPGRSSSSRGRRGKRKARQPAQY